MIDTDKLIEKLKVAVNNQLDDRDLTPKGLVELGSLIIDIARFESMTSQQVPKETTGMPALPFSMPIPNQPAHPENKPTQAIHPQTTPSHLVHGSWKK